MTHSSNGGNASLQQQLIGALTKGKEPMSRADVAAIVQQVMQTFVTDQVASNPRLYYEIDELARYIKTAKMEIAAIRPKEIGDTHIPTATLELDAVVGSTEEATNRIMDECDKISALAGSVTGATGEELIACVTRVYEACNFQDITGQRISKVVGALKLIETKVQALLEALGHEDSDYGESAAAPVGDKALLNGPQLPGSGASQDEIDKLLNS